MSEAKRDENRVTTLIGVSNIDGTTPVLVYVDPVTHRILVDVQNVIPTFVFNEILGGTVNGSNKTFTLAHTPTSGSQCIYLEGQRLTPGASNDYTITGSTVTLTNAPVVNPPIADYIY